MTRPILVCMSWRGGVRFERCLTSIARALPHFDRVVLSITSAPDSDDMRVAEAFRRQYPTVEILCTGRELPTMQHQAFWVSHLEATGAQPSDWVYWLAYDDEVRVRGIERLVDTEGNWPLRSDTVYFGPWAMRHEDPDRLWAGDPGAPLESWTSFQLDGPTRLPLLEWISDQLKQPTYMQMSGSVCPLRNFIDLRDGWPTKHGPMRIEMAVAASPGTRFVEEFGEPISIIYGRSNSDRATYGRQARREDRHLAARLARYCARNPSAMPSLAVIVAEAAGQQARVRLHGAEFPTEEWRVRRTAFP
ncbi:MAG: hypothetical protein ACKOI2_07285 [Actinomycetota bacterium]